MLDKKFKGTQGDWEVNWAKGDFNIATGVHVVLKKTKGFEYSQVICDSILPENDEDYLKEREEIEANMRMISESKNLFFELYCSNKVLENIKKLLEGSVSNDDIKLLIKTIDTRLAVNEKAIDKAL